MSTAVISEGGLWWIVSFAFGALIGSSEIMLRYRNDPGGAMRTPYGIVYGVLNGLFSLAGYWLLKRYASVLAPRVAEDNFLLMLFAGFSSMILIRSRLFTFRGDDDREYPIGPELLFSSLLRFLDNKIDGQRAIQRQRLVFQKMRDIDDFEQAAQYLKVSLLSFRGLTDVDRREIVDAIEEYRVVDWPDSLRLMALGFAILAICGEENFGLLVDSLKAALEGMKEAELGGSRELQLQGLESR